MKRSLNILLSLFLLVFLTATCIYAAGGNKFITAINEGKFGNLELGGRYIYLFNGYTTHDVSGVYAVNPPTVQSHLQGYLPVKGSMYKGSLEYATPKSWPFFLSKLSVGASYTGSVLNNRTATMQEDWGVVPPGRANPAHQFEFKTEPEISIWEVNLYYKLFDHKKFLLEPFAGYQDQRQYFHTGSANRIRFRGFYDPASLPGAEFRYSQHLWGSQLGLRAKYSVLPWLALKTRVSWIPYLKSKGEGRWDTVEAFGLNYRHGGHGYGANAEAGLECRPKYFKDHLSLGLGYLFNYYRTRGSQATILENNTGVWRSDSSNLRYSRSWSHGIYADVTIRW